VGIGKGDTVVQIRRATKKKQARNAALRFFALGLCLFYLTLTLLAAGFVITHAQHSHDHDGPEDSCAVCFHLAAAAAILKTLANAAAAFLILLAFSFYYTVTAGRRKNTDAPFSLITLRVRLNR
jgi:hypothetical protein